MICAKEGKGALALIKYMPSRIYNALGKIPVKKLIATEELRMGRNMPLVVVTESGPFYISREGELLKKSADAMCVSGDEIDEILRLLCDGSVYAVEENLKRGYITASGGHRVGLCGTAITCDGKVENLRDIAYINIRVAHEIIGSAESVIDIIADKGIKNTLVISPPGGGKTTLLRDIGRILGGDRFLYKVAVADERGELAAAFAGKNTNNVGKMTCVMSGAPKAVAMEMILRSMGPDVVITDEIGDEADEKAIGSLMRCGVRVIASAHGNSFAQVCERMSVARNFERIIILENKKVREVMRLDA